VAINTSFQKRCIAAMKRIPRDSSTRVVFAYSYAAKDIIDYARNRGWTTVLGQIDPGPEETRIVTEEYNRLGLPLSHFYTPPEGYWEDWRAETALADTIVVNSPWSADCLVSEGVAASKIRIIPCAYTPGSDASAFRRSYPNSFSGERPLKVLFLGQPVIRKGIHLVMEAAEALLGSPLRITVVGGESDLPNIPIPANVDWVGRVPRHNASAFYRDADVFLLPTLSDGFALTQLEASSWKLPLVVSSHCGEVVTDGRNGLVLPELSVSAIATALRTLLAEPDTLRQMSEAAISLEAFGLDAVGGQFVELVQSPSRSPMA
jgi:glycosyltransferase involved in cell wall biosynthesis